MNKKQIVEIRHRKFSLKTLSVVVVLVGLLTFTTTYYAFSPAVINVYLDDLPATATYTIKTDGTNIWAVRYDGYKFSESTVASTVIQAVVDIYPQGQIYIKSGTYDVSSASIKLRQDRGYHIVGDGDSASSYGTILTAGAGAGAKVFEIVDVASPSTTWRIVRIKNMVLTATNGYGIHCDWAGMDIGGQEAPFFDLEHLTFLNCKYGMLINDMFYSKTDNLKLYCEAAIVDSVGIWLKCTNLNAEHIGNTVFTDTFIVGYDTGILFDATVGNGNAWLNLIDFYHTEMTGPGNGIGIHFLANTLVGGGDIAFVNFNGVDIENFDNGIKMEGRPTSVGSDGAGLILNCWITDFFIEGVDDSIILTDGYGIQGVTFRDGYVGQNINLTTHACGGWPRDSGYGTTFCSIDVGGSFELPVDTTVPIMISGGTACVNNSGTSTGTGTEQVIAHGLMLAPTRVLLAQTQNATWCPYLSTASNATHIHVTAPVGIDYTWKAWIQYLMQP